MEFDARRSFVSAILVGLLVIIKFSILMAILTSWQPSVKNDGEIEAPCLPNGTCQGDMVCTYHNLSAGSDLRIYRCYPPDR